MISAMKYARRIKLSLKLSANFSTPPPTRAILSIAPNTAPAETIKGTPATGLVRGKARAKITALARPLERNAVTQSFHPAMIPVHQGVLRDFKPSRRRTDHGNPMHTTNRPQPN
jgi:hypothetical protein